VLNGQVRVNELLLERLFARSQNQNKKLLKYETLPFPKVAPYGDVA
jgi:hypothetical protein